MIYISFLNPCPAKLFDPIFHSLEAGIANAHPSFICLIMKNNHL